MRTMHHAAASPTLVFGTEPRSLAVYVSLTASHRGLQVTVGLFHRICCYCQEWSFFRT